MFSPDFQSNLFRIKQTGLRGLYISSWAMTKSQQFFPKWFLLSFDASSIVISTQILSISSFDFSSSIHFSVSTKYTFSISEMSNSSFMTGKSVSRTLSLYVKAKGDISVSNSFEILSKYSFSTDLSF